MAPFLAPPGTSLDPSSLPQTPVPETCWDSQAPLDAPHIPIYVFFEVDALDVPSIKAHGLVSTSTNAQGYYVHRAMYTSFDKVLQDTRSTKDKAWSLVRARALCLQQAAHWHQGPAPGLLRAVGPTTILPWYIHHLADMDSHHILAIRAFHQAAWPKAGACLPVSSHHTVPADTCCPPTNVPGPGLVDDDRVHGAYMDSSLPAATIIAQPPCRQQPPPSRLTLQARPDSFCQARLLPPRGASTTHSRPGPNSRGVCQCLRTLFAAVHLEARVGFPVPGIPGPPALGANRRDNAIIQGSPHRNMREFIAMLSLPRQACSLPPWESAAHTAPPDVHALALAGHDGLDSRHYRPLYYTATALVSRFCDAWLRNRKLHWLLRTPCHSSTHHQHNFTHSSQHMGPTFRTGLAWLVGLCGAAMGRKRTAKDLARQSARPDKHQRELATAQGVAPTAEGEATGTVAYTDAASSTDLPDASSTAATPTPSSSPVLRWRRISDAVAKPSAEKPSCGPGLSSRGRATDGDGAAPGRGQRPLLPSAAPPVALGDLMEAVPVPAALATYPQPEGLPLFEVPRELQALPLDDPRRIPADFDPANDTPAEPHRIPEVYKLETGTATPVEAADVPSIAHPAAVFFLPDAYELLVLQAPVAALLDATDFMAARCHSSGALHCTHRGDTRSGKLVRLAQLREYPVRKGRWLLMSTELDFDDLRALLETTGGSSRDGGGSGGRGSFHHVGEALAGGAGFTTAYSPRA